jgi:hypothetical protein
MMANMVTAVMTSIKVNPTTVLEHSSDMIFEDTTFPGIFQHCECRIKIGATAQGPKAKEYDWKVKP